MYIGLKHFHSLLAYLVLLLVAFAFLYALSARKRPFAGAGRSLALFALISAHLQLVVGIILYFISPMGSANMSGESMRSAAPRFYAVEHPLTMIIAIALITVGWSRAKRAVAQGDPYGRIALWYGIALVLILVRIPWSAWPMAAR